MKKQLITPLLLITLFCNATSEQTKQFIQPEKPSLSETVVRSIIIGAIAVGIYYATSGSATPFLGSTVGDCGTGTSIGLGWDALRRFYFGNPHPDRYEDIKSTLVWQVGVKVAESGLLLAQQKAAQTLEQKGWQKTALLIKPEKNAVWPALKVVAGVAAVQAVHCYYNPRSTAEGTKHYVENALHDLQLKKFLKTLSTTKKEKLLVQFPEQTFAIAYFKQEFKETGNPQTEKLIQQLQDGTLDCRKAPLFLQVQPALHSQFFAQWLKGMDATLHKKTTDIMKIDITTHKICTSFLKHTATLAPLPPLSQHAFAWALSDLLTIVREKGREILYGQQILPPSGYEPLLIEKEQQPKIFKEKCTI